MLALTLLAAAGARAEDAPCVPGLQRPADGDAGTCALPQPGAQFAPATSETGGAKCPCLGRKRMKIVMVTHGNFANGFWGVVEDAATRAGKDLGVDVSYRCNPGGYDLEAMRKLIDEAVEERPDGLAISFPDTATLGPAVERAVAAGIPTVSLNSGSDVFGAYNLLAHFGQVERTAGAAGCARLKEMGAKKVAIIDVESGQNAGLVDRAEGCREEMEGTVLFTAFSADSILSKLNEAFGADPELDSILSLNTVAVSAVKQFTAANPSRKVAYGTFDFDAGAASLMEEGGLNFAIDQQQYLQGYLPIVYLATLNTTGIRMQPQLNGGLVYTGPGFITIDSVSAKKCESGGVFYCGEDLPIKDTKAVLEHPDASCACIDRSATTLYAVIHQPASDPVANAMLDGLRQAATDQKVALEVRSQQSPSLAASLIDLKEAVAAKPYGIVATVPNEEFRAELEVAKNAGIRIITIGAPMRDSDAITDLFVGMDPDEAGKIAATTLLSGIRERGLESGIAGEFSVLCLDESDGRDAGQLRKCQGADAALRQAGGGRVVELSVDGTNVDFASMNVATHVETSEIPVAGVIGTNAVHTRIALRAASKLADGRAPLLVAAMDMPSDDDALSDPNLVNVILQAPYLQGYMPVVALSQAAFNGNSISDANAVIETAPYQIPPPTPYASLPVFTNGTRLLAARCESLGWEQCLCPVNTYSDLEDFGKCKPCPAGTSTEGRTGVTKCEPCQPGTFFDEGTGRCTPCPVGTAANQERAISCVPCNSNPGAQYQDEIGQRVCKSCPKNTHKPLGKGGVSIKECLCAEGYWRPDGMEGGACVACPEGAECEASSFSTRVVMPKPMKGFWTKSTLSPVVNGTSTEALGPPGSEVNIIAGFPFQRDNRVPVPKPDEEDVGFELPELFLSCPNLEDCPGSYECAEGKQDALCILCDDGYTSIGGFCNECPDGKGSSAAVGVTALGWICVFVVWVITNTIASSRYECFDIMLLFMQIVSIIQSFNVPWPYRLRTLTNIFTIVNFDVDFVAPSCVFLWNMVVSTYFTYSLPLIWLLGNLVKYEAAKAYYTLWKQKGHAIWRVLPRGYMGFVTTDAELEEVENSVTRSCATLVVIIYNAICIKAFGAFMCTETSDGLRFLNAAPDIQCGTQAHHVLIVGAVIAIPLYVIGIPAYLSYRLTTYYWNNQLHTEKVLNRWGFLYISYEPNYWWWPILFLVRRLVFCILTVFVADRPYFQLWIGVMFTIGIICLHYYFRPFLMWEVDLMDALMLVVTAVYLMCGAVYLAGDLPDRDRESMTVFLFVSTFVSLALGLVVVFRQAYRVQLETRNTEQFASFIAKSWASISLLLRNQFKSAEELVRELDSNGDGTISWAEVNAFFESRKIAFAKHMAEVLFVMLDTDDSGCLSIEELVKGLYELSDLNQDDVEYICSNVLANSEASNVAESRRKLTDWIEKRHTSEEATTVREGSGSATGKAAKSMVSSRFTSAVLNAHLHAEVDQRKRRLMESGGELTRTVDSIALADWIEQAKSKPDHDAELFLTAALVDQWTAPHLSNSGELGAYAYSDRAEFLRKLVSGYPAMIDYLMGASEREVEEFAQAANAMYVVQQRLINDVGMSHSTMAKIIVKADRAPFLNWLLYESTHDQRERTNDLFQEIYKCKLRRVRDRPVRKLKVLLGLESKDRYGAGAHILKDPLFSTSYKDVRKEKGGPTLYSKTSFYSRRVEEGMESFVFDLGGGSRPAGAV